MVDERRRQRIWQLWRHEIKNETPEIGKESARDIAL